MKSAVLIAVVATALVAAFPASANQPARTHVSAGNNAFQAGAHEAGPASVGQGEPAKHSASSGVSGHYVTISGCVTGAEAACHDPGNCPGGSVAEETYFQADNGERSQDTFRCATHAAPAAPQPQLTLGMIENAFKQIPLPASPLMIQPSGGRTIVNFPTIAYTTAQTQLSRSVTLLGHTVAFRIRASSFTWRWGDGLSTTTQEPGKPYSGKDPQLSGDVTHKYEQKATFQPRVDTTYTADYSVDGGAWHPVTGSVTIAGQPQHLRADTYTPVLVGH